MNSHLRSFPIALLTLCSSLEIATAADGDPLDRSACMLPVYEKTARIERYASKSEYEKAVTDKRFTCERLKYSSGGLPVIACGSYVVNDQLPLLVTMFHRLAEADFVVIAPMYRGREALRVMTNGRSGPDLT